MPVKRASNGKYQIGSGKPIYDSKEKAERAYKGYLGSKYGNMKKDEEGTIPGLGSISGSPSETKKAEKTGKVQFHQNGQWAMKAEEMEKAKIDEGKPYEAKKEARAERNQGLYPENTVDKLANRQSTFGDAAKTPPSVDRVQNLKEHLRSSEEECDKDEQSAVMNRIGTPPAASNSGSFLRSEECGKTEVKKGDDDLAERQKAAINDAGEIDAIHPSRAAGPISSGYNVGKNPDLKEKLKDDIASNLSTNKVTKEKLIFSENGQWDIVKADAVEKKEGHPSPLGFKRLAGYGITNDDRQGDRPVTPDTPVSQYTPVDPVTVPPKKGMVSGVRPDDVGERQGGKKVKPHSDLSNPAGHREMGNKRFVDPVMHSEAPKKIKKTDYTFNRLGTLGISDGEMQGNKPMKPFQPTKPVTPTTPVALSEGSSKKK